MKLNKAAVSLILIGLCVVLSSLPLIIVSNSDFGGADGKAEEIVLGVNPEYEPWFSPLVEPPGSETESLLFSIQAAFGGAILGYGFGYYIARHKTQLSGTDSSVV